MKILYLGMFRKTLINHIMLFGDTVIQTEDKITSETIKDIDFIVSYGYRHIVGKDIISKFDKKIINLHISLLPWNKGSDPNLWSFLKDTPKGVTIHYMDEKLDTGDVIVQKEIIFDKYETLKTTYEILSNSIEDLFIQNWLNIRNSNLISYKQPLNKGSYQCLVDKEQFLYLLIDGWDTPVKKIIGKAKM